MQDICINIVDVGEYLKHSHSETQTNLEVAQ